jgi:hypothetical protein
MTPGFQRRERFGRRLDCMDPKRFQDNITMKGKKMRTLCGSNVGMWNDLNSNKRTRSSILQGKKGEINVGAAFDSYIFNKQR